MLCLNVSAVKFKQLQPWQRHYALHVIPVLKLTVSQSTSRHYGAQSTNLIKAKNERALKVNNHVTPTQCFCMLMQQCRAESGELQQTKTCTNTSKHTALAMSWDLITDLRVIDVGGTGATYKIQNKGSILSAYRKNITQDQTLKAQQQEQKTECHGEKCRWKENKNKSPTVKHQQRIIILSKYSECLQS